MATGFESALVFIGKVKEVCGADRPRYQAFIDVLRDFHTGSANVRETTKRVIGLFQGHPELIEGFATFLPPGNTIHIPADPQGNITVTMATGIMEIAQDGTVVSETHVQTPEPQDSEARLPELAGEDKRLLEKVQTRIAGSEEYKAKYETFLTSFKAYLKTPPEQRKASLSVDQGYDFVEKLKELLGDDDEIKKVLSEVSS